MLAVLGDHGTTIQLLLLLLMLCLLEQVLWLDLGRSFLTSWGCRSWLAVGVVIGSRILFEFAKFLP